MQPNPGGIAEAFLIGEDFIGGNDPVTLILGDNIFFGHGLPVRLQRCRPRASSGATVFAYTSAIPSATASWSSTSNGKALAIVEKPSHPRSSTTR